MASDMYRLKRLDGMDRIQHTVVAPVSVGQDQFLALFTLQDISDMMHALQTVTKAKQEAIRLNESLQLAMEHANQLAAKAEAASVAKSQFLANMSHEIRTPMNGVIGMAQLLMHTNLTAEQIQYAETIKDSGQTLLSLISDILDVSKIEAGKMELSQVEFDLRAMVGEVMSMMQFTLKQKGLLATLDVSADIPAAVRGDPVRLKQVLTNLVGNAVKFTDQGEVKIEVDQMPDRPPLDNSTDLIWVRFTVRDTGIGISAEKIGRVFDQFDQIDASSTRRHGGTGLGLSIAKMLMDIQMPVMDGFEATHQIRALEKSANNEERITKNDQRIPIIAMTANAMQGDREKCISAGMDDYVAKPIMPLDLANTLSRWLPQVS